VDRLRRTLRDERGLSALETAIILIAFVVVAAVFAFSMLSAGMFSTERSKEAIYASLEEVRGSMQLRGSVIVTATTTGAEGTIAGVIFTVRNVAGGGSIDLTDSSGNHQVVLNYRDDDQVVSDIDWHVNWLGSADGDTLLEDGELAEIRVSGLENALEPDLGVNTSFVIEVQPPKGAVLALERTTPPYIDSVMDLH